MPNPHCKANVKRQKKPDGMVEVLMTAEGLVRGETPKTPEEILRAIIGPHQCTLCRIDEALQAIRAYGEQVRLAAQAELLGYEQEAECRGYEMGLKDGRAQALEEAASAVQSFTGSRTGMPALIRALKEKK